MLPGPLLHKTPTRAPDAGRTAGGHLAAIKSYRYADAHPVRPKWPVRDGSGAGGRRRIRRPPRDQPGVRRPPGGGAGGRRKMSTKHLGTGGGPAGEPWAAGQKLPQNTSGWTGSGRPGATWLPPSPTVTRAQPARLKWPVRVGNGAGEARAAGGKSRQTTSGWKLGGRAKISTNRLGLGPAGWCPPRVLQLRGCRRDRPRSDPWAASGARPGGAPPPIPGDPASTWDLGVRGRPGADSGEQPAPAPARTTRPGTPTAAHRSTDDPPGLDPPLHSHPALGAPGTVPVGCPSGITATRTLSPTSRLPSLSHRLAARSRPTVTRSSPPGPPARPP